MRILMISLDKHILDPASSVAKRMVGYGKSDDLFIVIPDGREARVDLSETVRAEATGGRVKMRQWGRLYALGGKICKGHRIEMITVQDPFFIGLIGVWLKNQFHIPLTVQIHGDYFGSGSTVSAARRWLARYVISRADRVRVMGERVRQSMHALGVPAQKIIVRPVATDASAIVSHQPKQNLSTLYPEFEKIFLAIGRLDPVKNMPWLVSVFSRVRKERPRYGLVIVGDGTDKTRIERMIERNDAGEAIRLLPWTNDPLSYIKTADCILFSSLSEGYGLIPMEAHAAGMPVIMTDVGVANFELKPGQKVVIVPVNDREAFIRAILKI